MLMVHSVVYPLDMYATPVFVARSTLIACRLFQRQDTHPGYDRGYQGGER